MIHDVVNLIEDFESSIKFVTMYNQVRKIFVVDRSQQMLTHRCSFHRSEENAKHDQGAESFVCLN